eukprot:2027861-Amphidinium_carterae.1
MAWFSGRILIKQFAKVIVRNTVFARLVLRFCVPTAILHLVESKPMTMRCGTLLHQPLKKGRKTVPEQLSVSPWDQVLPGQSVPEGVLRDNTSAIFGQAGTCSA